MAIAVVQSTSNQATTSGTTLSKAFASSVTAGNTLLVGVAAGSSSATFSVSDLGAAGNTFTAIAGSLATMSTNSFRTQWFICQNCNGGACTPQLTASPTTTEREIWLFELSGAATSGGEDASGAGNGTGGTGGYSINVTTVAANALLLGLTVSFAASITLGSGFTAGPAPNGNPSEYKTVATPASTAVSFTNANTATWVISAVSIAPATGGSTVNVSPSGQVTLGGSSDASIAASSTPSGEVLLSGSLSMGIAHKVITSGQVLLGGNSSAQTGGATRSTPSGQIKLGGSVTSKTTRRTTTSGQVILGGSSGSRVSHKGSPSGQVTLGGSVFTLVTIPFSGFDATPSGEVVLGGSVKASVRRNSTPAGQVVFGGSVSQTSTRKHNVSGQIIVGGSVQTGSGVPAPPPPAICMPTTVKLDPLSVSATLDHYLVSVSLDGPVGRATLDTPSSSVAVDSNIGKAAIDPNVATAALDQPTSSATFDCGCGPGG